MIVIDENDLQDWGEQLDALASVISSMHSCTDCAEDVQRIADAIRRELELS